MEEKERLLDAHRKERDRISRNIEILNNEIDANYSDLCSRCLEGSEFTSIREYLEHLGRTKDDALKQRASVEKLMAVVRTQLLEMLKEIKVLDALREKRVTAAKRADNKKHQKLLDDIALRLERK